MYVAFDQLPSTSRVWVYTASRLLSEQECKHVSQKLEAFTQTWQSHEKDMRASFSVVENRFLVLAADESYNDISGCGIDKSVHIVRTLENELGLSLTDKSLVVFEKEGKQYDFPFSKIREAAAQGVIDVEAYFYNTLVADVGQFYQSFKMKSSEGWVKKYFNVSVF